MCNTTPDFDKIHRENGAAHDGDVITDATLIDMGRIRDLAIFKDLHGMNHNCIKRFFSMNPTIP